MPLINTTKPVLLGRIAVDAGDLQTAPHVYAIVVSGVMKQAYGTLRLDSGDEGDWIDMAYEVTQPSHVA